MLKITIPAIEQYDEETDTFLSSKETVLHLEHSLVSLSKWESKWCKPFLNKDEKTIAETIDYIRCMTITQNVDPNAYLAITNGNIKDVRNYIEAPMTATIISQSNSSKNKEIITAELIYYWMIALNIPSEYQKWHLNRLLMLINVCNIKNSPPKKMSKNEMIHRNRSLNAARKKSLNSQG